MDNQTILQLVFSFLGGGFVSAVITQAASLRIMKKERRIIFLSEQIRELYGPLFRLVSESELLFQLNRRFHDGYKAEYIDEKYSENEITRTRVHEAASMTLGIANKYIYRVMANNEKILEVLDGKFSYADPEDIEMFTMFFEHHIRLTTERDEQGKVQTPDAIYEHVGDISFLRPEVIEGVKAKFLSKKAELDKLSKRFI